MSQGQAHMLASLVIKLQHWSLPPWRLAILGGIGACVEEDIARAAVAEMVSAFDASVQDVALHHRLTWEYFKVNIKMRAELDAFVSGKSIAELPLLLDLGHRWKFTPTVHA